MNTENLWRRRSRTTICERGLYPLVDVCFKVLNAKSKNQSCLLAGENPLDCPTREAGADVQYGLSGNRASGNQARPKP